MTDIRNLNDEQLHEAVFDLVNREMGPAAVVRFLQSFRHGAGDYAADRQVWIDTLSEGEIMDGVMKLRATRPE